MRTKNMQYGGMGTPEKCPNRVLGVKPAARDTGGLASGMGAEEALMPITTNAQNLQAPKSAPFLDLSELAPSAAAEWLIARFWGEAIPVLPATIARRLGIPVVYMRGDETSQVCVDRHGTLSIAVDEHDSAHGQRFAVAHVLGHILLGHGRPPVEAWDAFGNNPPDPRDREANEFAASLLVPTFPLRWCMTSGWMRGLDHIVDSFAVPEGVVLYRFHQVFRTA